MNQALASAAIAAITNQNISAEPGMCSRFVRQVTESVYEDKYDSLFGATALVTASRMKEAGITKLYRTGMALEPGDILLKDIGPDGHIAVYVGGSIVAENSSTHVGRLVGAKGFRTLGQFGEIWRVAKLPIVDTHA